MKEQPAFTVIEMVIAISILLVAGILGFSNINDLRQINADKQMKVTVNSLHYQLQAFHKTNQYYPQELSTKTLPGVAPDLLVDSRSTAINKPESLITYKPRQCKKNKCKQYTLQAKLFKEATFDRSSKDSISN